MVQRICNNCGEVIMVFNDRENGSLQVFQWAFDEEKRPGTIVRHVCNDKGRRVSAYEMVEGQEGLGE